MNPTTPFFLRGSFINKTNSLWNYVKFPEWFQISHQAKLVNIMFRWFKDEPVKTRIETEILSYRQVLFTRYYRSPSYNHMKGLYHGNNCRIGTHSLPPWDSRNSVANQQQSSVPELRLQCTLVCHWKNNCWKPMYSVSSVLLVVLQCVPIM